MTIILIFFINSYNYFKKVVKKDNTNLILLHNIKV